MQVYIVNSSDSNFSDSISICSQVSSSPYIFSSDMINSMEKKLKRFYDKKQLNTFMNSCRMKYINILSIKPVTSSYLWIPFIGDSLLRSPFLYLSSQLSGSHTIHNSSIEDEKLYELGNRYHYKDVFPSKYNEWSASETNKLHLDHVICCPISLNNSISCVIGIQEYEYNISTLEFIKLQVRETFHNEAICFSWHFQPVLKWAEKTLRTTFLNNDSFIPQAIIMNMGLHEVWNGGKYSTYNISKSEEDMIDFIYLINELYKLKGILFIYHKPLPMAVSDLPYNSNLVLYNRLIDAHIINLTSINGRVLDIFELAKLFHEDKYCAKGDGIHFTRSCMYTRFVIQWDLNVLMQMSIIQ